MATIARRWKSKYLALERYWVCVWILKTLQSVFMNSAVPSLTVGWCQQPGHLQCWAGAVLSNTRQSHRDRVQPPATSNQQPLLISDFIQNTIFGGGEARRGNEVEECQKCSSPLIDVTLLATRLQRSSLRRPGLHFPDIWQSSPSTRH